MSQNSGFVLYRPDQGVGTITLNRPEKLNALVGSMREDLLAAFSRAESDAGIRVVVITGAGRGFCAGGDIDSMASLQREANTAEFERLLRAGDDVVGAIRRIPKLVIASVNGVAAGAGSNLALACDYRIAGSDARIGATFVRIGLHPDWGGTYFLPRLVGTGKALEMLATGRMVESSEAFAMGLFDRVVPQESLAAETQALASRIAEGPPIPIADIKAAIYQSMTNGLQEQMELEHRNQLRAFATQDAREGMTAFLEKRPPRFSGR